MTLSLKPASSANDREGKSVFVRANEGEDRKEEETGFVTVV